MNLKHKCDDGAFNSDIIELIKREFFPEETDNDLTPKKVFDKVPKVILNLVYQTINYALTVQKMKASGLSDLLYNKNTDKPRSQTPLNQRL